MLANDNNYMAFNNFKEMPQLPYKVVTTLLTDESKSAEDFWKLLKYVDNDALSKPNLTYEEKMNLIWDGNSLEQNYNVLLNICENYVLFCVILLTY